MGFSHDFKEDDTDSDAPAEVEALVQAAFDGDLERVKLLVAAGVPINVRGRNWNPLHAAIENRQPHVVEFLLEAGADVEFEMYPGATPLFHALDIESDAASQLSYVEPPDGALTAMLLCHGADPRRRAPDGRTLADWADSHLHHEAARLLRDAAVRYRR